MQAWRKSAIFRVGGFLVLFSFLTTGFAAEASPQSHPYTDSKLGFEPPIAVDEANPCKAYYDTSLSEDQRHAEMEKRFLVLAHSKFAEDRVWAAITNSDLISHVLDKEVALQNLKLLLEDSDVDVRSAAIAGFSTCTGYREGFGRAALPLFKELWNHPAPETREAIRNLYLQYKSPKEYARQQGVAAAERDIKEEIYGIQVLDGETGWKARWIELIEQESFEVNPVPPSTTNPASYAEGYNETMRRALTKKYGGDRFEQIEMRAKEDLRQQSAGEKQAKADIKKGKFHVITYGLPSEKAPDYWAALAERYGVTVEARGCVVTTDELAYARGYNETVEQAVEAKHGKGVLAKTAQEFFPEMDSTKSQAAKEGEQAAEADLKARRFRIYEDISEPKWKPDYIKNLEKIGIEVLDWEKTAAKKSSDYCGDYNDVSKAAIEAQFGKYVFERAKGKAQRQYEAAKAASKK